MKPFKVKSEFEPAGDQVNAIAGLADNINKSALRQTLLGVTGSGKTFTMAKVIEKVQKPTLIISHNKTLAAQLYREFKDFFPENAVEYFVSYYDYYQPEAYVAAKDLYIEKDASINDEVDRMRLAATSSLISRKDVIVIATVSCIYGLGNPKDYKELSITLSRGMTLDRDNFIKQLIGIQYERDDNIISRNNFRVRGDTVELFPSYAKQGVRIEFFGNEIDNIRLFDMLNGTVIENMDMITIFPAKHFVTRKDSLNRTIPKIREEMEERVKYFESEGKIVEAKRLRSKTEYDLDMMVEIGYCKGIENYSRFLSEREPGERPSTLIDFFPEDYLMFIDESHVTIPQIGAMFEGDKARKTSLVENGFRLPSALDNRPLYFKEFENIMNQVVFVSATPGPYEDEHSEYTIEQIIRPTGLVDPMIEIKNSVGQIDDLIEEIRLVKLRKERILVTTLTKKMSEDLTDYLTDKGIAVRYLHSEIETIERVEIIKGLRSGDFDVLIGINLLREGIDIPEVSLVAILDADKVGFLRSTRSLIQIIGRAARNVNGKVIMYCDRISNAMEEAIAETNRRREKQLQFNKENNIVPKTIIKKIENILERKKELEKREEIEQIDDIKKGYNFLIEKDRKSYLKYLENEMLESAKNLEFEKAAVLRDEVAEKKTEWGYS